MAEDLEEDYEDEEGFGGLPQTDKRRLPVKKILIIALPVLLVIGAGGGLYFTGMVDKVMHMFRGDSGSKATAAKSVQPAVFMDLPELLVNLQTNTRKQSFLKIRVALELENPTDPPKIEAVMPRVVDTFQVYLRELRVEDLQGAAGMHLLREELLTRVSVAVKPVKVNDVLFREMLIQ